jgi:probable HAF family extracellular repeat protein
VRTDLGIPGVESRANAINDLGLIVGFRTPTYPGAPLPFVRTPAGTYDLASLGGGAGEAKGLNNAGGIVGWSALTGTGPNHAVLWGPEKGRIRDLGTLGGANSYAEAINEFGQIVGESETASGETHAFLWERGSMRDLGAFSWTYADVTYPAVVILAYGINGAGVVVGKTYGRFGLYTGGFRWDPVHGMVALDDLLPSGSGWQIFAGQAINDRGQIAGWGRHDGQWRGFVMTPIP